MRKRRAEEDAEKRVRCQEREQRWGPLQGACPSRATGPGWKAPRDPSVSFLAPSDPYPLGSRSGGTEESPDPQRAARSPGAGASKLEPLFANEKALLSLKVSAVGPSAGLPGPAPRPAPRLPRAQPDLTLLHLTLVCTQDRQGRLPQVGTRRARQGIQGSVKVSLKLATSGGHHQTLGLLPSLGWTSLRGGRGAKVNTLLGPLGGPQIGWASRQRTTGAMTPSCSWRRSRLSSSAPSVHGKWPLILCLLLYVRRGGRAAFCRETFLPEEGGIGTQPVVSRSQT